MKMDRKNIFRSALTMIACLFFIPAYGLAETADFDGLTEGIIGSQVTAGGITFFNLDNGQPGLDDVFVIDQADETITDLDFSSPNGLTATSYSPGTAAGYGAVKEMSMTIFRDADNAAVQIFTAGTQLGYGNTVTLEALKDDVVVDSISVVVQDGGNHFTLALTGIVFDTLRLVSAPNSQVLLIDNVVIDASNSSMNGILYLLLPSVSGETF